MAESSAAPVELSSLMDDSDFIAELDKLEGQPPRAAADRASRVALASGFAAARQPMPSASTRPVKDRQPERSATEELVMPRDLNRWNLHPPGSGDAVDPIVQATASESAPAMTLLIVLSGLLVGAASSAAVFHERVGQIAALFMR
jgi:hypothetical protein